MIHTFRNKKGFTLIELIVVIAIFSLLSAVIFRSLNVASIKSRNAARLQKVDQIQKAIEIGITGTTNKLPYSPTAPNVGWNCIGKSRCWTNFPAAPAGGFYSDATLDSVINNGMAGRNVPSDPTFKTGQSGDTVIYNSRFTTGGVPNPPGAYLVWVMEDVKGTSVDSCGRGKWNVDRNSQTVKPSYQCLLRIGDSVTTP